MVVLPHLSFVVVVVGKSAGAWEAADLVLHVQVQPWLFPAVAALHVVVGASEKWCSFVREEDAIAAAAERGWLGTLVPSWWMCGCILCSVRCCSRYRYAVFGGPWRRCAAIVAELRASLLLEEKIQVKALP
jgi:hypothetical protein